MPEGWLAHYTVTFHSSFLQCFHQHTLVINTVQGKQFAELFKEYWTYNAHVRHMTYISKDTWTIIMWTAEKQAQMEDEWPE
eukprot:5739942-Amphidinium_carterae.1